MPLNKRSAERLKLGAEIRIVLGMQEWTLQGKAKPDPMFMGSGFEVISHINEKRTL